MKLKLPVFFFNFALTLLLGEFVLRFLFGIQPGIILKTGSFHKVNKLKQLNGLYADSNGIFKATQSAAQDIVAKLQHDSYLRLIINHIFKERNNEIETKSLIWDFALSKKDENNPLSIYLNRLGQNLPHGLSDFDSAIIYYAMHPINAEGFKSIPFKQYKGKKKILMLGDSFTWGHSASHKTRSFADLLLYRGYAVYNTGISGADPAQYLAVAQKYIPLLKPDIVVVNFYMGNDIAYFKRELKPGVPIFYSTNAGQLFSCNDGVAFDTPEKAYAFVLKHYSIPEENNTFNYICAKSSMGTLLWKILNDYHKVDSHNNTDTLYYKEVQSLRQPRPYSNIQVDSIRIIAEQNNAHFLLAAIPDLLSGTTSVKQVPYLFDSLQYYQSPVPVEDYNKEDGHFTDDGHLKYANFIQHLVDSLLSRGTKPQ